eukprot:Selendium_serpulae@DN6148_c0_g3_i2.p1
MTHCFRFFDRSIAPLCGPSDDHITEWRAVRCSDCLRAVQKYNRALLDSLVSSNDTATIRELHAAESPKPAPIPDEKLSLATLFDCFSGGCIQAPRTEWVTVCCSDCATLAAEHQERCDRLCSLPSSTSTKKEKLSSTVDTQDEVDCLNKCSESAAIHRTNCFEQGCYEDDMHRTLLSQFEDDFEGGGWSPTDDQSRACRRNHRMCRQAGIGAYVAGCDLLCNKLEIHRSLIGKMGSQGAPG